ncbi:MAG: preprotein translocase subunit SecG [Hyphomonadaceae bacterium]|nr:preprotein translocase subunit SecG [Hyphomonadaceae bacterium]
MEIVVLGVHLLVAVCLIFLVLMQRSEGGALGMGGGGGSLMSGRGAADALARMTSVAGGFFLVTSLGLTMLSGANAANSSRSVLDSAPVSSTPAPVPAAPVSPPREDPTESSLPAETQLASAQQPVAATPAVVTPSAARAAPLDSSQQPRAQPAATTRQPTSAAVQPTRTASAAQTSQQPPPRTPPRTQTSTPATSANGAVSGINLTDDPAAAVESSQNGVEAVRRERAGPDQ